MNGSRSVEGISKDGKLRAVYNHFDMGKKGRIQELREDGHWITTEYCDDYPQLMHRFHALNVKCKER